MKSFLCCILLMCSSTLFAADALTMDVDATSSQFTVQLPANPTTGYQWTIKNYDKSLFHLVQSYYLVPHTKRMGAGGKMKYIFVCNKGKKYPDTTTMMFTYARAWEPGKGSDKQVIIHFN